MNNLDEYIMGFFIFCLSILLLVGAGAVIVEVQHDITIGNNNNAHNVQVLRIQ